MPIFDPFTEVEGYAEAVEREGFSRDAAFIGIRPSICGIEVSPLTMRHLLWLQVIDSPFIGGDLDVKILHLGIAGFFKTLAPLDFFEDEQPSYLTFDKESPTFKDYMKRVGKVKVPTALKEIKDFITEALQDSPGGSNDGGKSYYSMAAGLSYCLCKEFGMSIGEVMDMDLRIAFQLVKAQRRVNNPKALLFNGSEKLITRHFEKIEKQKAEKKP